MEQSPSWKANRFSVSQEIPRILWKPKAHYPLYKCHPTHFLKIHFHIIHPSTPGPSKWSLSVKFPHQNHACTSPLPCACYIPRPPHYSPFDHPNNIWWAVQLIKLHIMYFRNSLGTSSLLSPTIILSPLFSNTLSLLFSLKIVTFHLIINKLLLFETESLNYIKTIFSLQSHS